jgi:putative component of toxin-antitoxin plasmid stabilization module
MDSNTNTAKTLYKPDDLRNLIRQLLSEQNLWTRFLIISKISKLGDVEVVTNRLFENAIDFGNLFRIYYGDTVGKEIENSLRTYFSWVIALIDAYMITTFDTPENTDYTLINQVNNQLCAAAGQFSKLLHDINPNWSQETFQNIFSNNINMLNDEIYKRRTNQFYADVTLYDYIEYYFLMTADILWKGFLKQFYQ